MSHPMDTDIPLIEAIQRAYPNLQISSYKRLRSGYVNDVLLVNDELLFRFPQSADGVANMLIEHRVLSQLQGHLSLPIPQPEFFSMGGPSSNKAFIGYRKLEGEPLGDYLSQINAGTACTRIALPLAQFLRELHDAEALIGDLELPVRSTHRREGVIDIYEQVRASLWPQMILKAQGYVAEQFEQFLNSDDNFLARNRLRHGDLNPNNVLIDTITWRVTGIIDFGSTGLDDPATDLGQVLFWSQVAWGEGFGEALMNEYGAIEDLRKRALFYKILVALIVALEGLQNDDREAMTYGLSIFS